MKKLLIHNNNTSFNKTDIFKISEQFVFDVDFDKDVDLYIHEQLTRGPNSEKILASDILFIKVSLSKNNYLEYLGLRLAYHIRLTKSLGEKVNIPIVLIGEESFQFLGLTYPDPSILFTKGIYLISESIEEFQKMVKLYEEGKIKSLDDMNTFVNSILVNPPSNYNSHHSIANEWSLVRYNSMFEKDEKNEYYDRLQKKISDLDYLKTLHFKYLDAKATRQNFNPKKHTIKPTIKEIEGKKIGIIDDEISKGWFEFYAYIFDKSNANAIVYDGFKKDDTKEELIANLKIWILEIINLNEPVDVFIIDLRLHDDDFAEQNFENITGIQIIRFIKNQNPGIQIVVSSASNKVWNYQQCLDFGVKYFSIKESPETFNNRSQTLSSFNHLCVQISNAVRDSYLANIYRKIKEIKSFNIFINNSNEKDKQFVNQTFGKNGLLDQIFNLLLLNNSNQAVLDQCLLIAFQILENYCELSSIGNFEKNKAAGNSLASCYVWSRDGKNKKIFFINQQKQKISTLFQLKLGRFPFQQQDSNETPIDFNVFEAMKLESIYKSGLDITALVKIIAVLYFRDNVPKKDVEKIMALRYYRSNVAAHLTGNVKPDFKINAKDIMFIVKVFTQIFK